MRISHLLRKICASTLLIISALNVHMTFGRSPQDSSNCYPNDKSNVVVIAEGLGSQIVKDKQASLVDGFWEDLIFYVLTDITLPQAPVVSFLDFQHFGETARTDKQIGTSSKSSGSTSLAEKPGYAQLLGFALEHGAIKQSINDTTLTLSTTPYAFAALINRRDTSSLYQNVGFLNRLGVSASFNISDQEQILANASRKQLSEWSVRLRLTGDRSSRSPEFRRFWVKTVAPLLQKRLAAQSSVDNTLFEPDASPSQPDLQAAKQKLEGLSLQLNSTTTSPVPNPLKNRVQAYLNDNPDDAEGIKSLILCYIKEKVYDPIKNHEILTEAQLEAVKQEIAANILPRIASAQKALDEVKAQYDAFTKTLEGKQLSTLEYTNHRVETGSDFSEIKLLYQMKQAPMNLIFNAGITLYNNPNRMMNQERVRDYNFALSFEGETRNPFVQLEDLSKITYSFSGAYQRMKENEGMMGKKPDIANVQFRVEIPVATGFSIPVAYTFASATETSMKKENRFNIGLRLDVDKLYSLARLKRQ